MRHRAPSSTPTPATPLVMLLLVLVAPLEAVAATALASLEPAVRDEIVRRCLPTQYREGANAYRNCVTEGVTARDGASSTHAALGALSLDDRYAIERACGSDGDTRCITGELDALEGAPDPFIDGLAEDERHAVRRQCFAVQGEGGVAAYRRCLDDALVALEALPEPDLDALSLLERNALASRCSTDDASADEYRRCLLDAPRGETAALAAVGPSAALVEPAAPTELAAPTESVQPAAPAAPTELAAPVEPVAPAALASSDVDATRDPANVDGEDGVAVRRLVLPAVTLPDEQRGELGTRAEEPVVMPQATAEETAAEASTDDESVDADALAVLVGNDPDAPPRDLGERIADARERLVATVAGLDGTERIVFGVALALPLLLLGIWAASRGGARTRSHAVEPQPPVRNPGLVGRVSPPLDPDLPLEGGRRDRHPFDDDDIDDARFLGDLDDLPAPATAPYGASPAPASQPEPAPAPERVPESATPAPTPATMSATAPVPDAVPDATPDATPDTTPDAVEFDAEATVPDPDGYAPATVAAVAGKPPHDGEDPGTTDDATGFVPRSDFGARLLAGNASLARQHAIEFLIYWMAYGDERYEPEARTALLQHGGDVDDPHDLIKRHVLEEDTLAFADVVRWVQHGTRELQRVQILDLLMVLLISERAMTPAQNTLLHFLADAFGLGATTLDERHEEAFGSPMPPLARPDIAAWWAQVEHDRPLRWDARAIAGLDELEQFRIRLGLPLEDGISESEIVEGFRRAARRCHPHRFDELGERERGLAERQFVKFEDARDRLLGVNR